MIKIKGVTPEALKNISIQDLYRLLLDGEYHEFTQSKWFKSIYNGEISVKDQIYMLKATNNKRKPVYVNLSSDERLHLDLRYSGNYLLLVGTRPYSYDEIEQKPISNDNNPTNHENDI